MKTFRVQQDFNKFRPAFPSVDIFGKQNIGFLIEGETPERAIAEWNNSRKEGNRLNPFYLKITEI